MTDKELKHSIGRLIMPRLNVDEFATIQKYRNEIERQVRVGKSAGFCLFGGTPQMVLETTSHLQEIAKEYYELPLLFSCDAEWGVTMRLREGGTSPARVPARPHRPAGAFGFVRPPDSCPPRA